jgi:hypothetical protein
MAELSVFTKQLQSMLPQWMKMAKDPNSVGGQFLNVFGLEFQDIKGYLNEIRSNQFIGTADVGQIDITYKVPLALPTIVDNVAIDVVVGIKGSNQYAIKLVDTLREFYGAGSDQHVGILDRTEGMIYTRPASELIDDNKLAPYDSVLINGTAHYDLILHHVWNAFDEFGLLLGLQRLYGERNDDFRVRIEDVFVSPGNSTRDGLYNALSRELGIDKTSIKINELSDMAFKDSLLNSDGSPTQKLISYADNINKLLGFTWDNMSWDEAYWRSIEEANMGLDYLPHIWNAQMDLWNDENIQSGVGDGNDLLVYAPTEQSNVRDFKYNIGLRGVIKDGEMIHPEHSFKYKIVAKGTIISDEDKPENYRYTVIASEIIYLYYLIRAFQQYDYTTTIDFVDSTGFVYDGGHNLEIVPGTTIMSPKAQKQLEVQVFMETKDKTATPKLDSLNIGWKDTTGTIRSFPFDTQTDFDRNDPTVAVLKQNLITTVAGDVELGYGDFYHVLNTEGDWKKGSLLNTELTTDGSIRLITPKI